MRKIILVPDSFKGTMSAIKICNIMDKVIRKHFPSCETMNVPAADGGEGTVDCFLEAMGGEKVFVEVSGPLFDPINAFYGILPDGTAVIEMAAAAGLPLVEGRKDPKRTTTYGVGQLIKHAIMDQSCRRIIIGLGGSSTTDGGAGMACALGVRFFNAQDQQFIPTGGTLGDISRIDTTGLLPDIESCQIIGMCDVDNPLFGKNGAAYIYGPQKGADEESIMRLDQNLQHLSRLMKEPSGMKISEQPGAGAAGGLGAGILFFLKGSLRSGIETVLDTVRFDTLIKETDLIFTGEGKIDGQSLRGKVVAGVAKRAQKKNIPVIAVVGDIADDAEALYEKGVTAIVSINRLAVPFSIAATRCEKDLEKTMDMIMRMLKIGHHLELFFSGRCDTID